jgi:integrase
MRPGEIFGLKWANLEEDHADVRQRVYKGKVDSPKTARSVRTVGFPQGLQEWIRHWRCCSIDPSGDAWVFPSERMKTPVTKDNCWRRHFLPKLRAVGLGWVNFQVMRRTHASLMRDIDPKIVADQLGHSLDVNLNVYTQTGLNKRKEALDTLESALRVM